MLSPTPVLFPLCERPAGFDGPLTEEGGRGGVIGNVVLGKRGRLLVEKASQGKQYKLSSAEILRSHSIPISHKYISLTSHFIIIYPISLYL